MEPIKKQATASSESSNASEVDEGANGAHIADAADIASNPQSSELSMSSIASSLEEVAIAEDDRMAKKCGGSNERESEVACGGGGVTKKAVPLLVPRSHTWTVELQPTPESSDAILNYCRQTLLREFEGLESKFMPYAWCQHLHLSALGETEIKEGDEENKLCESLHDKLQIVSAGQEVRGKIEAFSSGKSGHGSFCIVAKIKFEVTGIRIKSPHITVVKLNYLGKSMNNKENAKRIAGCLNAQMETTGLSSLAIVFDIYRLHQKVKPNDLCIAIHLQSREIVRYELPNSEITLEEWRIILASSFRHGPSIPYSTSYPPAPPAPPAPSVGAVYQCKITRVGNEGAFVALLGFVNCCGLLPNSEMTKGVAIEVNSQLWVRCVTIAPKLSFSMKFVDQISGKSIDPEGSLVTFTSEK